MFVQLYPVEDIVARYNKWSVCGPELLKKLHSGTRMERCEQIFFVKAVCRYLIKAALMLV